MKMAPLVTALVAFSFSPVSIAQTVLHCGKLIDPEKLTVSESRTILVEDGGLIASVEQGYQEHAGETIDLRTHTCMPGLMDMHVHFASDQRNPRAYEDQFRLEEADHAFRMAARARITLQAGFTTVRDLGSANRSIALKRAIEAGLIDGPRIFNAGKAIATTGGHGDPTNGLRSGLVDDPGPVEGVVNGVDEARKAVRQRYKDGADLIKITATGGVMSLTSDIHSAQFTEDEIRAVVETARDYGFHVAAHAHSPEGMKRAIRAGVNSIEHGTLMDDDAIALFVEHGTWWVPTLSPGRTVAALADIPGRLPDVVRAKVLELRPIVTGKLPRAYKAGVKIAFGTDAGPAPHGDNGREFVYMVEEGMPPLETIRSATLHAAQLLGIEDEAGTISSGKLADIVATPEDPREDIETMTRVSFVMKGGKIYKRPDLNE